MQTFGIIAFVKEERIYDGRKGNLWWCIRDAEPHVCIKLKSIFSGIAQSAIAPFYFEFTPENSYDLRWFMDRYPLDISDQDRKKLNSACQRYVNIINEREAILLPGYTPEVVNLKDGLKAREYQLRGCDMFLKTKRLLNGDDMGLGKTLQAILAINNQKLRPAAIVVQSHLIKQWEREINKFTYLNVHIVTQRKPYDLPKADVYIFKYTCLSGWVNLFDKGFFKSATFDECQELRRTESDKYQASEVLSGAVNYCQGLSGTPIYNYGIEIFNIMNVIKSGCLGNRWDFMREWCGNGKIVKEPKALGSYMRRNHLFLRRTRKDVGRELPVVNRIVHTVGYDSNSVKDIEDIAKKLAITLLTSKDFVEQGSAAQELNWRLREATGVSKAREVAAFVKILLDSGEPVVLSGWHRAVYDIWLKELAIYNPVMYTGTESVAKKESVKQKFINGETNLFIISNRSGIGLDGLQYRAKIIVNGELDWSPEVHNQLIARVDRDGQQEQVTAFFMVTDWGSDPVIIDVLGIKASQSHNIINPFLGMPERFSDESRTKLLAQRYLDSLK